MPAAILAVALTLTATLGAARADERIVAFGDSITVGAGDGSGGGYPARLARLLSTASNQVVVENEGLGSETTAGGLSRLGRLRGATTDAILIMEGINDIYFDISTETTISNLLAMDDKARQRGFGTVYVATVTPLGDTQEGPLLGESIALSERIREATYARGLPMPDPHQAFLDLPGKTTSYFIADQIHPNAAGYDVLAEHFADFIRGVDRLAPAYNFAIPSRTAGTIASDSIFRIVVFDPLSGVDLGTAKLLVNDNVVDTEILGDPGRAVLQAQPGNLEGEVRFGVDVADRASPPNRRREEIARFRAVRSAFLTGDIDRNGRVDGADLVLLGSAFGARPREPRFDARADLDGNGRIDGLDLAQLAANFGRSTS